MSEHTARPHVPDPGGEPIAWTVEDLARNLRCSPRHVRRLLTQDPTFPRPRRLGRLVRWSAAEVRAWLDGPRPAPSRRRR